jgi:Flp pilus assembly protein TadD
MAEAGDTTLYAFYDFQLSPVSFDFATFLLLARLEAAKHHCKELHIVLVPGPMDGFRHDDAGYDLVSKHQRLHNIVMPLCAMTDLPVAVSLCTQRSEAARIFAGADGPVFPGGYSVQQPAASFLISGVTAAHSAGDAIPSLRATNFARRNAADWLDHHCRGKRAVTITLREATYAPERNSNRAAWIAFARSLDTDRYEPIFIRDSEVAVAPPSDALEGLLTCPIASFDLHFRHALYELSYLNLTVPNGPAVLCWLNSRIRFVMFNMITEGSSAANVAYHASMGLAIGGQAPFATPFQRLVWEPDTLEVIEREFTAMAARIGDTSAGGPAAPDPANAEAPLTVALRLQSTGRLEEASAIYQSIVQKEPNNADAWHLLGIIAHQADRPEVAERMIRRAISLRPGQANFHINLAAILRKVGRADEAADSIQRAIALSPQDAGAHADLAELLQAQGASEKAKAALLEAIRLKPDSPELCERSARVLHALGHTAEAAGLYGRAVRLREARQKQVRRARAHMSEIPVATLKTV